MPPSNAYFPCKQPFNVRLEKRYLINEPFHFHRNESNGIEALLDYRRLLPRPADDWHGQQWIGDLISSRFQQTTAGNPAVVFFISTDSGSSVGTTKNQP